MARGKYEKWLEKENLELVAGWARNGLTEEQIAHNMGCSYSTFRVWRDKYPALSAVLKKSREVADAEVENALFKRATGYDYVETVEELRFSKKTGQMEMVVTKRTTKHMPPNVGALIFWLKNRKPEAWQNQDAGKLEIEDLSEIEVEIYGDPKAKNN